jgi:predicted regulator of Ras-like GTPase activity (Roadblock/LC7/MglB family)
MSFQAYLDTVKAKTGLDPADFAVLAAEKGLVGPDVKTGAIVAWLAEDFGLGRGHAMAIVATLGQVKGAGDSADDRISAHFSGAKAKWRGTYDAIVADAASLGDVTIAPTNSYLSLVKAGKKFAVVATTGDRLDLGVKLPGEDATERLETSGAWNAMVTHRVRITDPAQLDAEVHEWVRRAYERA